MKKSTRQIKLGLSLVTTVFAVFWITPDLRAGSAQWSSSPSSGDWNTANNWTPATVPNGSSDTATFASSAQTAVSISANTQVNGITFDTNANAFNITASAGFTLTVSGAGVANDSGTTQNLVTAIDDSGNIGTISFRNNATVGSNTIITNSGATIAGAGGGVTQFRDSSTAGSASFVNNPGTAAPSSSLVTSGGFTSFANTSSASNATLTNNAANASGRLSGYTFFVDSSDADNAIITNNGATVNGANGGVTSFGGRSSAGNATLIANGGTGGGGGGTILFRDFATGGTSRVELFGNGNLDVSFTSFPGVTVGSIEGDGNIFLGYSQLSVGSSNLDTTFSGMIQDGGLAGGAFGRITKIGTGTLTLSGANTYTGGTTVSSGTLLINNSTGSGTGTGRVQVNGGTLGGLGTIAGAVTIGTGSGTGAVISPGTSSGTLTIQSTLLLNSDATYKFELNSSSGLADKIVANGVTINGGAFSFTDLGSGHPAPGTTFVIIDNTSSSAISGVFSNLPDNSSFTANGNSYQVSYEGGTGNDLTLSVVPEPSTLSIFCGGILLLAVAGKIQRPGRRLPN